MSFAFPKVEAETGVPITGRNASFTDYLGLKFTIGAGQTAGRAITGFIGDMFDDSEMLDPKKANMLYGNPDTGLVFDEPIREERAKAMQTRHDLNAISQAELDTIQNVGAVKGAAGFITQMIGGMSHPIDFSMNFIPFVGQAKLVKAGMGPMSRSLTRGLLLSEETIARNVTFPRITSAVIDATAGNILAEIPVAIDANRNKEDYSVNDFAMNILGGALVAGTLKGITLGLGRAREAHAKLTPEIQDRMLRDAIQQTAVGKSVDVHSHATIDPKLMEAEWKEREAAIRASFTINGPDQVIVSPAIKDSSGTVRKGQIHALIEGAGEDGSIDGYVTNTGEFVTREQAEGMSQQRMGMDVRSDIAADEIQDPFRRESYLESELKQAGESEIPALVKQIEATRAEINAMGYDLVGDKYVQTRASEQSIKSPEYQAFVKERIDKYVAEQKKLFDVEYQKKLAVSDAAREKQTIGPLAKPEDIAKLDGTRVPEAAIADIAEDARALSADAEADLNVLEVENPELADHIRKEIKKQMGAIDDPQPKAIEAALNCLINE